MLTLIAEKRELSEKVPGLRRNSWLPGVVYGFEMPTDSVKVNLKDFKKIYQEAGENTLIALVVKEGEQEKRYESLIKTVQRDPLNHEFIHVDFYHPSAKKKIKTWIPIIFEGEAPAVRDFGGTVIKELKEIKVRGLAAQLPREIKVDLGRLKQLHDRVLIKDLSFGSATEILADPESIVALAVPAEAVEKELEKPVDESVEPVKVEEEELPENQEEAKDQE